MLRMKEKNLARLFLESSVFFLGGVQIGAACEHLALLSQFFSGSLKRPRLPWDSEKQTQASLFFPPTLQLTHQVSSVNPAADMGE